MIYDWRTTAPNEHILNAAAITPCEAHDLATGAKVPKVFYYDSEALSVGRYLLDSAGNCIVLPDHKLLQWWETRELVFVPKRPVAPRPDPVPDAIVEARS